MNTRRCLVSWREGNYWIDCDPSSLLSVAAKIAEAEGLSYLEVLRYMKAAVRRSLVMELEPLLSDKP